MSSTDLVDHVPCSIPPPPPPPPPLPVDLSPRAQMKYTARGAALNEQSEPSSLMVVEEAMHYAWQPIAQACSGDCISMLSVYNHCDSVIQSGPTCGLVALMVCLKLVKPELNTELTDVLSQAQSLGYTKYGEMFSAENMSKFISQVFAVKTETRQWLEKSRLDVIEHLCFGLPLLVPYDADSNYEPCLKEGKRAHWATLCGFCLVTDTEQPCIPADQADTFKLIKYTDRRSLLFAEPRPDTGRSVLNVVKGLLAKGRLYVYARQGKSRRVQLWNYEQLCRSNRNLSKVSSKILNDAERKQMVYPPDGDLTKSLANKFILIFK